MSITGQRLYHMVIAALLCAVGIIIPIFSPIRIVIEPMSFTLASHVAIFIAMFISVPVAAAVALGTTLGFFLGGFPIVIVLRALSHLLFATIGALYLRQHPQLIDFTAPLSHRIPRLYTFGAICSVIHALAEVCVVIPFYFGQHLSANEMIRLIALLVGVGSFLHSMIDFTISIIVWKPLQKVLRQ